MATGKELDSQERAKWRAAYKANPLPLQRDVSILLGRIRKDGDVGVHNKISEEIKYLCPNIDSLVRKVTTAILNASSES